MKKIQILIILVIGVILLGAFASVTSAANTVLFTVNNRTTKTLEVTLLGVQNYIISVSPLEKASVYVKPGDYQYSYYDCGQLNIDTIDINEDVTLKITQCGGSGGGNSDSGGSSAELVDIVLNNKTYKQLTVGLVGIANYSFDLIPGKTFVQVYKGTYQLSYYDCGKLNISTAKITKDGFQAKIYNCGQVTDEGSNGGTVDSSTSTTGANEIQFFVKNDTYTSFDILFLSDLVYTYPVIPGKNKISIQPGAYQYSYYACGELWVGDILITNKNQDIRISSCSSTSGRPDTGQNIVFKVKNMVGTKFAMTLNGPQFYTLNLTSSTSSLFEVEKGYYTFQYYACGTTVTGEIYLKNGVTLKTITCPDD